MSIFQRLQLGILSLRYLWFRTITRALVAKRRDEEGATRSLDLEQESALQEANDALEADWIRKELRRVPYWRGGHYWLTEHFLKYREFGAAYASAQAVVLLSLKSEEKKEASFLLGKVYLRSGELERAHVTLRKAYEGDPENSDLCEELAACELALGHSSEARRLLELIPVHARSQSVEVVLKQLGQQE